MKRLFRWEVTAMVLSLPWFWFAGIAAVSPAGSVPPPSPADHSAFLPNPALTPGDTLAVTKDDVCVRGYPKKIRNVPAAVKAAVYREYGLQTHKAGEYEVDHLISLELGGSNSIKNLWPQSYRTQPWSAHVKDALENELHAEVCAGTLPIATAQQEIRTDWITCYQRHFHTALPLTPHLTHPKVQ